MKTSRLKLVGLLGIIGGLTLLCGACSPSSASVTPSPSPTIAPQDTAVFVTSMPIPTSTPRPSPVPMITLTPMADAKPITLTIVYDNRSADPRLGTAWGFACLIETEGMTILFDTGGDGRMLMDNLTTLGIDPQAIDAVVLSHVHSDHTGGLDRLLAANDHLTVYLPKSFPTSFKTRLHHPIVEVNLPMTITDHIRTTGELGTSIIEQSLIIESRNGLLVLTGCAHPGLVEIVRQATTFGNVYLVMGGFHLADYSVADVHAVIAELKALGVRQVAPGHCTGDQAIEQFRAEFGTGFVPVGAGVILQVTQ